jgi:uncharacterized membrane protein YedE/YeeE
MLRAFTPSADGGHRHGVFTQRIAVVARCDRSRGMRDMTLDWTSFTPWSALAGGVLIGVAVGLLVLLTGRIAGISGVLGGVLRPARRDIGWRVAFLVGMIGAPVVYAAVTRLPQLRIEAGTPTLVIAGLLVGIGTRYAGGCTSGHGVCGVARLSPRSLTATALFMAAGFLTVFVVRHVLA